MTSPLSSVTRHRTLLLLSFAVSKRLYGYALTSLTPSIVVGTKITCFRSLLGSHSIALTPWTEAVAGVGSETLSVGTVRPETSHGDVHRAPGHLAPCALAVAVFRAQSHRPMNEIRGRNERQQHPTTS